ncbi:MAG: Tat pathway signal protein [Acetobacteraceae bacterium]|nr:Tat pathway signal protein [Acetobacteraceae bacterium]
MSGQAFPQPAAELRLELNRLEPRENAACRVWFVLNNRSTEALDPVRLDLVIFGRDGVVARRIAVDVGPLPSGRTQARIFDVSGLACEGIGQLLLNDLLACGSTETSQRNACMDRVSLASRVEAVPFEK